MNAILDTINGLIRWDRFYFLNESFFQVDDHLDSYSFRLLDAQKSFVSDMHLTLVLLATSPKNEKGSFDFAPELFTLDVKKNEQVWIEMPSDFDKNFNDVREELREARDIYDSISDNTTEEQEMLEKITKVLSEHFKGE